MTEAERKRGLVEWGVFVHEPGAPTAEHYRKERAIKLYKSQSAAEKFARARNLVVRGLDKNGRHVF